MANIFDASYGKKIFILGFSEKMSEILQGVSNISKTMYITTHDDKYQITVSGLVGMDSSPLEIVTEKVDEFNVPEDSLYYNCHCDWKTGIPLEPDIMNSGAMYMPKNDMVDEMLREFLDNYENELAAIKEYKIVATDVFVLSISNRGDLGDYGYFEINEDALTPCLKEDLEKVLKVGKNVEIKDIDDSITL